MSRLPNAARSAPNASPTPRAMSTDEWTEAVDRRQRRHGGERHTQSGAGWVTVWIGPLNDGRTALLASAGPTGSTTPTATAAVSCADTPTAMELADELLAGGRHARVGGRGQGHAKCGRRPLRDRLPRRA